MVIRIPVIVDVNVGAENIIETLTLMKKYLKNPKVEFLPYHTYGEEKYRQLGMLLPSKEFRTPTDGEIEICHKLACEIGVKVASYR